MGNRLGVDIGGTFTDVVLETAQGAVFDQGPYDLRRTRKTRSSMECTRSAARQASARSRSARSFMARRWPPTLIERRGAKTALITTKGFRDVIEMRTESRFEQYDLNLKLPDPLLPRERRYVLEERIGASGTC
jgi:N-methylhydantoinase A